jgi:hypothetical protein
MREDALRPAVDRCEATDAGPMRCGRRTNSFDAERLAALVKHLYFQLGKLEREVASELGISRRMVNYYKNQKKR